MNIRQIVVENIRDLWSGEKVPHPYSNEYARGQFELAVHLLGFNGQEFTEDAILELYDEVMGED